MLRMAARARWFRIHVAEIGDRHGRWFGRWLGWLTPMYWRGLAKAIRSNWSRLTDRERIAFSLGLAVWVTLVFFAGWIGAALRRMVGN